MPSLAVFQTTSVQWCLVTALQPSHLILLDLVLGRALPLAFPPQLLQVRLGTVQRVLLHLVLGLIALEGSLHTLETPGLHGRQRVRDA